MLASTTAGPFQLDQYVLAHIKDRQEWHLPFLNPIHLPDFISLHGLMLILCAGLLIFLFCFAYKRNDRVPTGITNLLECFVQFVRDEISVPSLGYADGIKMTPMFCTLFFFILGLNMIGQVPLFAAATANVSVTAPLALIIFYIMTIGTIQKNGFKGFIKALVPSGVPKPILILIVPLEVLGLFIKTFALLIRLFANMLAGHMVISCLLGLIVLFGVWAAPAIILAVGISLLEVLVVFLQAYIFVLLSAVFIGQMHHPEH